MFWKYTRRETKILLAATLLFFATGALFLGRSWVALVKEEQMLATSVGVFAGVEENEVNTLVAELDEREKALNARELALRESTIAENKKLLMGMTATGASLLVLILFNFYLDSRRRMSMTVSSS